MDLLADPVGGGDRLIDAGRDPGRCETLRRDGLIDRLRDGADGVDGAVELGLFGDQRVKIGLYLVDIAGGVPRGLAGLSGQGLYLMRDDREAAPGLARPCRLDRGVEREQVGPCRNGFDE